MTKKDTLPQGTTYTWKSPVDTSTTGIKTGIVAVTYPDGTKTELGLPANRGHVVKLLRG